MAKKPDFIIIGAMKSATTSLHSQLALHNGIFMTTPKEPNFFSDDDQYARGLAWYEGLFRKAKPGDLCGESSTHYTKLPDYPLCTRRMKSFLPEVKLIYMMRQPIDRLVSHYIHQWSQNVFECDINQAVDQFPELIAYSSYTKQLEPYFDVYGKQAVLPVFFEAITTQPQQELERVARFLSYDQPVAWHEEKKQQNVSSERIKRFPGYDFIVESDVSKAIRRAIIPKALRDRVKNALRMTDRPELNPAQVDKLTRIFDEDLKKLGGWLGVSLDCANFKKIAKQGSVDWK